MNKQQYEELQEYKNMVWTDEVKDRTPRLLAYGRTKNNDPFEVWFTNTGNLNREFEVVVDGRTVSKNYMLKPSELYPDYVDGLYSDDRTDFKFCMLLINHGVNVNLYPWEDPLEGLEG